MKALTFMHARHSIRDSVQSVPVAITGGYGRVGLFVVQCPDLSAVRMEAAGGFPPYSIPWRGGPRAEH